MRRYRAGFIFLAMLLMAAMLPSCDATPAELEQNRLKWEKQGKDGYTYTLEYHRFKMSYGPVVVRVENGECTGWVATQAQPMYDLTSFSTIDRLFAAVGEAYSTEHATIKVDYDPEHGFPVNCQVDLGGPLGSTWGFGVTEFRAYSLIPTQVPWEGIIIIPTEP